MVSKSLHGPNFSKCNFMPCLKNNHSRDLNSKFQFNQSNHLDIQSHVHCCYRYLCCVSLISTLLDRIAHVCITTAHARRSGRSAKFEINKPATSKLVRSLYEKLTVCLSPILHFALIFAHALFYLRGCLLLLPQHN